MKVTFEGDEPTLTLFEAAIWIGGKGWNLSDRQTESVFTSGATELFNILASERLVAKGVRRETQLREDIPSTYWERADEYPEPGAKKHYVSFIEDTPDDPEGSGFGGMLTPYGDSTPRWTDIRLDGPALRAIYPFASEGGRLTDEEVQARDELIGRCMRGEVSPSDADAEALRRFGSPLETEPSPAKFRPDREPWWTLTMALAWIVRRDLDFVRRYWNEYRRKWWVWRRTAVGVGTPREQVGWLVEPQGPISLSESLLDMTVETSDRDDGMPVVSVLEAEKDLLSKLRGGKLPAIAASLGERSPIPDYAWIDLGLSEASRRFAGELWVRREDVVSTWNSMSARSDTAKPRHRPRNSREAAITALKELYPDTDGDPGDEKRSAVRSAVEAYLRKPDVFKRTGVRSVSIDTIRRAIEEIRAANGDSA